jgi:hypothetical protein
MGIRTKLAFGISRADGYFRLAIPRGNREY